MVPASAAAACGASTILGEARAPASATSSNRNEPPQLPKVTPSSQSSTPHRAKDSQTCTRRVRQPSGQMWFLMCDLGQVPETLPDSLRRARYLNLATLRRDGRVVETPPAYSP